jgi:hypothetical protein
MEEARTFLLAWADEFMAAGFPDPELRNVMDYELQAAARNLKLTTMQRSLLWHEILLAVRPGSFARRQLQRLQRSSESCANGSPSLAAQVPEFAGGKVQGKSAEDVTRGIVRSDWLDEKCVGKNWNQKQLRAATGLAVNTIRRWRSGQLSTHDRSVRGAFKRAFGCPLAEVPK